MDNQVVLVVDPLPVQVVASDAEVDAGHRGAGGEDDVGDVRGPVDDLLPVEIPVEDPAVSLLAVIPLPLRPLLKVVVDLRPSVGRHHHCHLAAPLLLPFRRCSCLYRRLSSIKSIKLWVPTLFLFLFDLSIC